MQIIKVYKTETGIFCIRKTVDLSDDTEDRKGMITVKLDGKLFKVLCKFMKCVVT